ncbi:MAG: HAD family phosphatase [Nitrospiraceae bacterium]|nr:HAD family phosphatase [Nitrospiraceae bacterium]
MIKAAVFDLDGVLVETERLKALSYARAALRICPGEVTGEEVEKVYNEVARSSEFCPLTISEDDVIETYKSMVGRSRQEMAGAIMKRFNLEATLASRMKEFGVTEPWQVLIKVRLPIYESLIEDPAELLKSQWPHNVSMVQDLRARGFRTGLGTMSDREHAEYILKVIGLLEYFDCVLTADDISRGKPDPEIYQLIIKRLGVAPAECIVFEDSPSGVRAGLAAGMHVIAVTTPFTQKAVHEAGIIDNRWIVDDPGRLGEVVETMLREPGTA